MHTDTDDRNDTPLIAAQLRRPLSVKATVARRCATGYPLVIKNTGRSDDGAPFPTLYWLTCPEERLRVARLEAAGFIAELQEILDENQDWRNRLLASDTAYRAERGAFDVEGGIAGCRDDFKVKCLHAHAADWLVAGLNPVGERVIELAPIPSDCHRCEAL